MVNRARDAGIPVIDGDDQGVSTCVEIEALVSTVEFLAARHFMGAK